jgi:hypothetical protein
MRSAVVRGDRAWAHAVGMPGERDGEQLEVRLTVWRDDPISGRVEPPGGPPRGFVGWVGLMAGTQPA